VCARAAIAVTFSCVLRLVERERYSKSMFIPVLCCSKFLNQLFTQKFFCNFSHNFTHNFSHLSHNFSHSSHNFSHSSHNFSHLSHNFDYSFSNFLFLQFGIDVSPKFVQNVLAFPIFFLIFISPLFNGLALDEGKL